MCGLPPVSGIEVSTVLAGLELFIHQRIGVILEVVAELWIVVHCPLNPAVVAGLVAHQF